MDRVFDAWKEELERHRATAKTKLAQDAIALWSDRKNVPYWGIHTTNLLAWTTSEPFREGTTINFEPIGQAFFLRICT